MPRPATDPNAPAPRGKWFDEFVLGQIFHSAARTVTEADITAFAGLSGDFNPLHTDAEFAAKTPFRSRIAHGLLVQSIASGLANQTALFEGTIAALQEMTIRFRAPVFPGDTIRMELEVIEIEPEPAPRRGWVRFAARVRNQRAEIVVEGEWLTLMQRQRTRRSPGRGKPQQENA